MADKIEGLVRRAPEGSEARSETIVIRVKPSTKQAIQNLAETRKWTMADAVRSLLRTGLDVELKRQ